MVRGKECYWCCWRPLQITNTKTNTNTKRTVLAWSAREGACASGAFVRPECLGKAGQRAEFHGDRGAEKNRKARKSREDLLRVRSDGVLLRLRVQRLPLCCGLGTCSKSFHVCASATKSLVIGCLARRLALQKAASAVLRVLAGQVARFGSVFRALRLAVTAVAKQGTRCGDFEHALTSARCCGSGQRPAPQWQMGRQVAPRWWGSPGFLHAVRCAKAGAGSV